MKKLDPEAATIMKTLLSIIADEFSEAYPDHTLVAHCGHVFSALAEATQYLSRHEIEVPFEVLDLMARFVRAANQTGD